MRSLAIYIFSIPALLLVLSCANSRDWRTASRESAGLAPKPEQESEAIVHVYAARAFNWRGWFGVHTWVATKEKGASHYTTYEVIEWRLHQGLSVVKIEKEIPDRQWFGTTPELITELKGAEAEAAIPKIKEAAASYPYPHTYRLWPGPNSNTFVSHIIRNTPQLKVELPPTAIGKDWIGKGALGGLSETKTGVQLSVLGALGFTVGTRDGVEINILGLTFGFDILRPAVKLPFIGRLGMKDE